MADPEIRPARPDEFASIGDTVVAAYDTDGFLDDDVSYADVLRDVARRAAHAEVLVAVEDTGDVTGAVTVVWPGTDFAEISREGELEFRMLAVAPGARGRGIGEALIRAVLDRALAARLARVVLCSLEQMHAAHRLYERLGFTRLPGRDWQPFPRIRLLAYGIDLVPGDASAR